jgi:hypothetical protein
MRRGNPTAVTVTIALTVTVVIADDRTRAGI